MEDPSAAVEQPIGLIVLIGALSGVIGSIIGPIISRLFARNDRALDTRQKWIREKLQAVFGIGDEPGASDGPTEYFYRLVIPNGYTPHFDDMHQINWAVSESPDYMLLHPRRSKWARKWLYNRQFILAAQGGFLHGTFHYQNSRPEGTTTAWERANERYVKRVNRTASSISVWATGQWLTHSSLWILITGSDWYCRILERIHNWQLRKVGKNTAACDCVDEDTLAEMRRQEERMSFPFYRIADRTRHFLSLALRRR